MKQRIASCWTIHDAASLRNALGFPLGGIMNKLVVIYIFVTLVANTALFIIWTGTSWLNRFLKFMFAALMFFGAYLVFTGKLLG